MPDYTPNLNLPKPSGTEVHNRAAHNALVDAIDASARKVNFTATSAPTIADDASDGYAVGSRWLDALTGKEYTCLDATAGAAIWQQTGGGAGSKLYLHQNYGGW